MSMKKRAVTMDSLIFVVNGVEREIEIAPGEMLADVLRMRLGLTGTKVACGEAECGACTVILDGEPVLSCILPAIKAQGREVLTIEGLADGDKLHPLQDAFIKHGAVQCGFCTPGQIMTLYALLQKNPNPTEDDIRKALKDTLCRCGTYPSIVRAAQEAANSLTAGKAVQAPSLTETTERRIVGKWAPRPDAFGKVTGRAKYTDDYRFPNMLHARVLRADVPHAILRRLDVSQAQAMEGVHAVLTAEDIPGEHNHGLVIKDWPVLVGIDEHVRYVGDALALVAADTRDLATQALELIQVEFEDLDVVNGPMQAHDPQSPWIHETGNLLKEINIEHGDIESGFDSADVILEDAYNTPIIEQAFMEPECSIACTTEEGRIEVHVGSQLPHADRDQIAACLGEDSNMVRVVGTLIGGSFGGKEDIAGQIHAAMLAQATGKPVKLLYDRRESLLTHAKRHATQINVRLGAKRDGTLVAAETKLYGDTGAYASLGPHVMERATTHSSGPYSIPNVRADCYAMYTNNPPAGAFRGFGALQAAFAIESAMDEMAKKLGMNPIELRKKNAFRVGSTTNTGQVLTHSVGLLECIEKVEAEIHHLAGDRPPFEPRSVDGNPQLRSAWGFAVTLKNTSLGGGAVDKAAAEAELFENGRVQVRTSSTEIGQGLVAVLQMIAAEELNTPLDTIDVLLSDTDLTPDGGPTTASRQTYMSGNAVRLASIALRELITSVLVEHHDCSPEIVTFQDGHVVIGNQKRSLVQIAALLKQEGRDAKAFYEYTAPETRPLGMGGDMHFAFSFAAQAAEVEVDMKTGEVHVPRVIAAMDVGRIINPLGLEGQIEGGVIMGLGHTLTERFLMEDGHVLTDRLSRYRMPSILHTPQIICIPVEHPTQEGPYGAKGVGEISSMPTPPAITNAIHNACGVRVRSLPVDQDWLAREIASRMP
jgi:CO/xanthine dehydrogenase Mo-binding subunit/aerobic-type carbon monoxide dehydrogenase small subunit (CoxS/CutS family)